MRPISLSISFVLAALFLTQPQQQQVALASPGRHQDAFLQYRQDGSEHAAPTHTIALTRNQKTMKGQSGKEALYFLVQNARSKYQRNFANL
jgi:hypothetical protein